MDNTEVKNLSNEELVDTYLKIQEFTNFLEKEKENIESGEEND